MCISPNFIWTKRGPEWVKVPRPCGDCWRCKENYVSDWVGRCLAEADTSAHCLTLSLTYATPKDPNDISHRVLHPYHFQLFIKRLRKAGHKIRYLVAGEYGDLLGRSHFHCILFFTLLKHTGKPAPYLMNRAAFQADPSSAFPLSREMPEDMCHIREWPHGHVKADWSASEKSVRYCCEYLNKQDNWFSMSKKPPLGAAWFAQKARQAAALGVFPSSFEYLPPGGKPGKVYLMTGATRRDYLNLITTDPCIRPRMSEWVRKTFDKLRLRDRHIEVQNFIGPHDTRLNQEPVFKTLSRLALQDAQDMVKGEAMLIALAHHWGFEDVEEFESWVEEGGSRANPEYLPGAQHLAGDVPDSKCKAGLGKRACDCVACAHRRARVARVAEARRQPTRFDRQGRPVWGDPSRDYLPTVSPRTQGPDPE